MLHTTRITIEGYLVGPIWWPVGAECWKTFKYDVLRERGRYLAKPDLRDHVLAIINDGDFQHGSIAQSSVIIEMTDDKKPRLVRRVLSLTDFPSVKDCLRADHDDWYPDGEAE